MLTLLFIIYLFCTTVVLLQIPIKFLPQTTIKSMESMNANVYDICKTALLADYLTVQASSINRKFLNKFIPPKQKNVNKLIDHVRDVFSLNEIDMSQIIRNCQSFCTEEFALVDLLIRRNMLDQDCTPEYMPGDFDYEDDYILWKQAELKELDNAINYITQHYPHTEPLIDTPLPTQNAKLCFIPNDPKTVYYALLEHLISFEDTLSNSSTLLLSECGRRWRLSLAFRAYSYLNLIWKNNKAAKYSSTMRICEMIRNKEFLLNIKEKYDVYLIFKKIEKLTFKHLENDDLLTMPWSQIIFVLNKVYLSSIYRKFHKPDIPSFRISKVIEKSIHSRLSPLKSIDRSDDYFNLLVSTISVLIKDTQLVDRLEIEDDSTISVLQVQNIYKVTTETFLQEMLDQELDTEVVSNDGMHIGAGIHILDQFQDLKELGLDFTLPNEMVLDTLNSYMLQTLEEMREWCARAINLDNWETNNHYSSCVSDVFDVLRTKWLDIRDTCWYQFDVLAHQRIIYAIYLVVNDISQSLFEHVMNDFVSPPVQEEPKETIMQKVERIRGADRQALQFKIQQLPAGVFVKLNDLLSLQEKLNELFVEIKKEYDGLLDSMDSEIDYESLICRLSIDDIKGIVKHDAHEGVDYGFICELKINENTHVLQLPEIGSIPIEADECVDFVVKQEQVVNCTIYSQDIYGKKKKYATTNFTVTNKECKSSYYQSKTRIYNLNTLLGSLTVKYGNVHDEYPFYYFNKSYLTLNDFLQVSCSKVVSNMMNPCIWFVRQLTSRYGSIDVKQNVSLETVEEELQPIFDYLNKTFGDLMEISHTEISNFVLRKSWKEFVGCVEVILVGDEHNEAVASSRGQITTVHFIFNCLEEFFHAQGSGVELNHLHNPQYHRVNGIFKLYYLENDELMQMYLRSFVNYAVHKVEKYQKKPVLQIKGNSKLESSSEEEELEEELKLMQNTRLQPNTPLTPPECEAVVKLLEMRSVYDQECADFLESQQGIQQQVIMNLELEKVKKRQEAPVEEKVEVKKQSEDYKYTPFQEQNIQKPVKTINVTRIPKPGLTDVESLTKPRDGSYYERSKQYLQ
eukprot:NODE_43_length_28809_cov_0.237200.p1 type:complete len:1078 gc:universal NODE_43_length_28809_cov_0.237200:16118-19351(+)